MTPKNRSQERVDLRVRGCGGARGEGQKWEVWDERSCAERTGPKGPKHITDDCGLRSTTRAALRILVGLEMPYWIGPSGRSCLGFLGRAFARVHQSSLRDWNGG
jgi:hypothetical protein